MAFYGLRSIEARKNQQKLFDSRDQVAPETSLHLPSNLLTYLTVIPGDTVSTFKSFHSGKIHADVG
jgi:hypothetical protein